MNAIGTTNSIALNGLQGNLIQVETSLTRTHPFWNIVGLPDTALNEAKDRVRSAINACGVNIPPYRFTINLCPAAIPKTGSSYDLAIAISVLKAMKAVSSVPHNTAFISELGLDGALHGCRGILPLVMAAKQIGLSRVIVAKENESEARLIENIDVQAYKHLSEIIVCLGGKIDQDMATLKDIKPATTSVTTIKSKPSTPFDLKDIKGQPLAKKALEIAAAGGHHLLMLGPPGNGKTLLARALPSIMPKLTPAESLQTTSIHSIAGISGINQLVLTPPFESPHHSATPAAIIGGGTGLPLPGAVSRATNGILFLDEAPEFTPRVLQTLRQPLEEGRVIIHRAKGACEYPAQFLLILAANPCPCGMYYGDGTKCSCSVQARMRYFSRLSGPLLDRIDLEVFVHKITSDDLAQNEAESSEQVAIRVANARTIQAKYFANTPWSLCSQVPGSYMRKILSSSTVKPLYQAYNDNKISLRGVDKALRVAWTLATLRQKQEPDIIEVTQALAMRPKMNI